MFDEGRVEQPTATEIASPCADALKRIAQESEDSRARIGTIVFCGFLTLRETAQTLRLTTSTVRLWLAQGRLPAVKVNGSWRVPVKWLAELEAEAFATQARIQAKRNQEVTR